MIAFFHRLVNTENGLRIAALLLFLPMFFFTQGSILCTTDTGAYLQTISNIETQGLAAAIPMDDRFFTGSSYGLASTILASVRCFLKWA